MCSRLTIYSLGLTDLMRAAKNGQINDVESQLTKGASVHEKDYNGNDLQTFILQ